MLFSTSNLAADPWSCHNYSQTAPPPQATGTRVQRKSYLPSPTHTDRVRQFRGRWRVLCFPSAGSAEDMFTSEGTGSRKAPSPLLVSTASGPPAGSASASAGLL